MGKFVGRPFTETKLEVFPASASLYTLWSITDCSRSAEWQADPAPDDDVSNKQTGTGTYPTNLNGTRIRGDAVSSSSLRFVKQFIDNLDEATR